MDVKTCQRFGYFDYNRITGKLVKLKNISSLELIVFVIFLNTGKRLFNTYTFLWSFCLLWWSWQRVSSPTNKLTVSVHTNFHAIFERYKQVTCFSVITKYQKKLIFVSSKKHVCILGAFHCTIVYYSIYASRSKPPV